MKRIKKKTKRFIRHEQWIEIMRKDGKTVTLYYPPNEQFEIERLDMDPPPDMIYRRMNFIHGVPAEYSWLKPTPEVKLYGGLFLQRITLEEWPTILQAERMLGNQHVVPAKNAQPRPPELGPCPCPLCVAERADPSGKSRYDSAT